MMRYACRAIAGVWLVVISVAITSAIWAPPSGSPATWVEAWQAIGMLAAAMALGWVAGVESEKNK